MLWLCSVHALTCRDGVFRTSVHTHNIFNFFLLICVSLLSMKNLFSLCFYSTVCLHQVFWWRYIRSGCLSVSLHFLQGVVTLTKLVIALSVTSIYYRWLLLCLCKMIGLALILLTVYCSVQQKKKQARHLLLTLSDAFSAVDCFLLGVRSDSQSALFSKLVHIYPC